VEHIKTLFSLALVLFDHGMEKLQKRVRYVKKEDFDEIRKVINEIGDAIQDIEIDENDDGNISIRLLCCD